MLILRTILESGEESNQDLGDNYHLLRKNQDDDRFNQLLEYTTVADKYKTDVFAVVSTYSYVKHIPLFKNNKYYIMTDSGKTFTNLTHHEAL